MVTIINIWLRSGIDCGHDLLKKIKKRLLVGNRKRTVVQSDVSVAADKAVIPVWLPTPLEATCFCPFVCGDTSSSNLGKK